MNPYELEVGLAGAWARRTGTKAPLSLERGQSRKCVSPRYSRLSSSQPFFLHVAELAHQLSPSWTPRTPYATPLPLDPPSEINRTPRLMTTPVSSSKSGTPRRRSMRTYPGTPPFHLSICVILTIASRQRVHQPRFFRPRPGSRSRHRRTPRPPSEPRYDQGSRYALYRGWVWAGILSAVDPWVGRGELGGDG